VVDLKNKIQTAISKFDLNLQNKTVLTEAATGNYVVTPIIAAVSGASKVYAFTNNSKYGTTEEVARQTSNVSEQLGVASQIEVITCLDDISLNSIDILTNTGFLRPINKHIINQLSSNCVIPLMWETWEFRERDLDLDRCRERKIKVYGTNEDDERLRTKDYIGLMVVKFLSQHKLSPSNTNVLVLGCDYFNKYVENALNLSGYKNTILNSYETKVDASKFDAIVLLEHYKNQLLIGKGAFIEVENIPDKTKVIHICGNVDFSSAQFQYIPDEPAPFGYMSYTVDNMGDHVVIDLHAAGFKVAEGMLEANKLKLEGQKYKTFMETHYPAMAFEESKYW
jgi:hypothetical protein